MFHLNIGKMFFTVRVSTGCPERSGRLHRWWYSEAVWTWYWAASLLWPCLSRELDHMTYKSPYRPQPLCHSVISMLYIHASFSILRLANNTEIHLQGEGTICLLKFCLKLVLENVFVGLVFFC